MSITVPAITADIKRFDAPIIMGSLIEQYGVAQFSDGKNHEFCIYTWKGHRQLVIFTQRNVPPNSIRAAIRSPKRVAAVEVALLGNK